MRNKSFFMLVLLFLCCMASYAQDFVVDGIYYNRINDSNVEVTYKSSGSYYGTITIPSEVTYNNQKYNVIAVGEYAFSKQKNSSSISSVTLPSSTIRIGKLAFSGMTSLKTVNIPEAVKVIESYAFNGCTGLTSIVFPGTLKSIGDNAFKGCTGLTEILVPTSVKRAGNEVFYNCTGLTKVTYSADIKTGGSYIFSGCTNLSNVTISPGVTNIGLSMFRDCTSLTSISLPSGVKSIGSHAFYGCTNLSSITLPDGIEEISNSTFDNTAWYNNQPDGLVYIGKYLYSYKGIMPENSSIEIKDGTVLIADNCFSFSYRYLTSVSIPNSVKYIGRSAFSNCTSLSEVILPETGFTVGANAFNSCRNLTNVENADNIIRLERDAFSDTPWFRTWSQNQPDGELYLGKCMVGYKGEMPSDYTLRIKEGTICVAPPMGYDELYSFYGLSNLKGIEFPSSLKYFNGNFARTGITSLVLPASVEEWGYFSYCEDLVSVEFPSNMEETPAFMFQDCTSLKNVTIPQSVTKIGNSTFSGCTALGPVFTIPEQIEEIGDQAFINCSGIKVVINKSLIRIPDSYGDLGSIAEYVAYSDNQVTSYSGFLFAKDSDGVHLIGAYTPRKDYVLPDTYIDGSSYDIVANAFAYDDTMESIQIGKGVTAIGNCAFTGTSKLKEVKFNATQCASVASYLSSNEYPFYDAGDAQSGYNVTFGENVKSVPNYCFYYGTNLKTVSFGSSVTSIGESSFAQSGLISIEIPSQITSIGSGAFGRTEILQEVRYSAETCSLPYNSKIFYEAGKKTEEGFSVIIEDNVKNVPANLFNSGKIKSISIGKEVKTIGSGAFSSSEYIKEILFNAKECTSASSLFGNNMGYNVSSISIIFSDDVVSIPKGIFSGISNYTWARPISITIGENVTSIGTDAFANCYGLTKLNYNAINCAGFSGSDDSYSSGGRHPFYYAGDKSGGVDIVIGNKVKTIPAHFLSSHEVVKSLTIEGEIETIGDYAFCTYEETGRECFIPTEPFKKVKHIAYEGFRGCKNLGDISNFESVESIDLSAFYGCTSLTDIDFFKNVSSIGAYAFNETGWHNNQPDGVVYLWNKVYGVKGEFENGSEIVVKEGTEEIMPYAFSWVYGVNSVKLPSTLKKIGEDAFLYSSLTSIELPFGLTSIGSGAFSRCSSLTSVSIPSSVTEIGLQTFDDCSSLTSIEIPSSVNSIGNYAFSGCYSLTSITMYGVPETIGYYAIPTTATIYVPQAIHEDALAKFPDNEVIAIVVNFAITAKSEDETMGSVEGAGEYEFGTEVTLTAVPAEGYEFVQWSDASTENPYSFTATEGKTLTATFRGEPDTDIALLDNTIYVEPFEAIVGQTAKLSVKMKNNVEVKGFQFDLYLPEGVTVATDEDGFALADLSLARTTKNKTDYFNFGFQRDGAFRVLCGSTKGYTFNDTDGEVCTIELNIAEDMEEGDFPIILKTVEMTDKGNSPYTTDYLKSTLTVSSYTLGDVNNDGKVTITDFMCAADAILGNVPTPYIERAADFNNDGTVTVSDLMSLADYILSGDAPAKTPARVRQKADEEQTDNYIYLEPVTATHGGQQTLSVKMKNSESIKGYQVDIYLPDGMTFAQDADGFYQAKMSTARTTTAKTDYFGSNIQSDGGLRLLCGSTRGYTFSGNDGEVATVVVNIPEGMEIGNYSIILRNCEVTNITNTAFTNAYSASELTITDGAANEYAEGYNLQIIPFVTSNSAANELTLNFAQAEENVTDIEFDIVVPAEMTRTKSGRALKAPAFCNDDRIYTDDHSITMSTENDVHHVSIKAITNDEYRIIAGEEGTLVTLYFTTATAAEEGLYDFTIDNITMTCDGGSKIKVAPYKGSILIGEPELSGSQVLYGNYAEDATVLNKVAAMQSVTSLDFTKAVAIAEDTTITTGNKNTLIYLAEGMQIANTENVVASDECENLVLADGYPFFAPKNFSAQSASYRREGVNADGWYSCVVPFDAEIPAGVKVEEFGTFNGTSITLLPLQSITANTPFFFKPADSAFEVTAENVEVAATTSSMFTTGDYTASYETTAAGSITGKYALKADGSGFGRCDEGAYLVPFRAVLTIDNASNARVIDVDRSTPTGLDAVADTKRNAEVFDIQGRRVANATKAGIYVANGQKYIVK